MPSVFATIKVKADKVEEAKKNLAQMAEAVRSSEPGNIAYIFHQRKDDPTVFMAYEKYADDAAFEQHRQNMAKGGGGGLADLIDGAPEIVVAEEI